MSLGKMPTPRRLWYDSTYQLTKIRKNGCRPASRCVCEGQKGWVSQVLAEKNSGQQSEGTGGSCKRAVTIAST